MKGIRLRAPGGLDNLAVAELVPAGEPGPGEIRVRLHASSLNYHDYRVMSVPGSVAGGRIPMSDGAGVVDAVGAGVTEFRPGEHVVSCFFPGWISGEPFLPDFATVPGDGVDGDSVLVLGSGGVSIAALQLAKAMGATVIATSSSDEKRARLAAMGAAFTLNYRSTPDWGSKVKDWTGGLGVDHVVEVGGPGTLPQSIEAVRVGGHISLIGVLTGRSGEIPTGALMRKQARLHGLIVGNRSQQQDYVRALEATGTRPVIDSAFPLEKIADAFRHEESGRHFGKICLEW